MLNILRTNYDITWRIFRPPQFKSLIPRIPLLLVITFQTQGLEVNINYVPLSPEKELWRTPPLRRLAEGALYDRLTDLICLPLLDQPSGSYLICKERRMTPMKLMILYFIHRLHYPQNKTIVVLYHTMSTR
jgi:hypothetical protein